MVFGLLEVFQVKLGSPHKKLQFGKKKRDGEIWFINPKIHSE